jgi:hypothetical protein
VKYSITCCPIWVYDLYRNRVRVVNRQRMLRLRGQVTIQSKARRAAVRMKWEGCLQQGFCDERAHGADQTACGIVARLSVKPRLLSRSISGPPFGINPFSTCGYSSSYHLSKLELEKICNLSFRLVPIESTSLFMTTIDKHLQQVLVIFLEGEFMAARKILTSCGFF